MQIKIKEFSPCPITFANHAQTPNNRFLDVDYQVVN